ncbi:Calcium and integrin-binding member 3 [Blastocladiella emersonii ATCC 22665]|nr:Calcium and integrin-binding member 3 [Blastocladiella emersonii ATCC 22665]
MGNKVSVFSEEEFEWFEENTFFRRSEIMRIYRYFERLTGGTKEMSKDEFVAIPELQINPFRMRIAEVFSNEQGIIEFEDFLDFLSVFSEEATRDVKSFYAFRIYDFDEDDQLGFADVRQTVECQVGDNLSEEEIETIVAKVFAEADIDGDEKLSFVEFDHVIARCPDFINTFKIRI